MPKFNIPKVAGIPKGWTPVEYAQSTDHPRHAVVLCKREPERADDCNWVCWNVNTVEGGCHNGVYGEEKPGSVNNSYLSRVARLGSYK